MLNEEKIRSPLEKAEAICRNTPNDSSLSDAEMAEAIKPHIEELAQVYFSEVAATVPRDGQIHTVQPGGEQVIHTLLPPAKLLGVQIPETPQLVIRNLTDPTGSSGFVTVYRNDKWSIASMIEWSRYADGVAVAD